MPNKEVYADSGSLVTNPSAVAVYVSALFLYADCELQRQRLVLLLDHSMWSISIHCIVLKHSGNLVQPITGKKIFHKIHSK